MNDSLFRTSLVDGTVRRTKVAGDYTVFLKLVGNTVYAAVMNFDCNNESRIMILQADDLMPKDSIRVPAQSIRNLSILSTSERLY